MVEEWREVAERVRNWGRWGDDDQLGTLNFITPEKTLRALQSVRRGHRFSLAIPLDAYGPWGAHGYRRNPIHLMTLDGGDENMTRALRAWQDGGGQEEQYIVNLWDSGPLRWADDFIIMPLQASTQWDSLAHVYYDGQLYNGYPASMITSAGAAKNGIDRVARVGGIIGRAVLVDVARHLELPHLEPGFVIGTDLLDAVIDAQGVTLEEGDTLVIRTGWRKHFLEHRDPEAWLGGAPGISWRVAEWLHVRQIAAIASDNPAVEVIVPEVEHHFLLFHMLAIRDMGMSLGEIWDLEALAADCAEDHVYEFLLVAPPLLVPGGVGSPINPVAIK
jgi:kynurenine formamidase